MGNIIDAAYVKERMADKDLKNLVGDGTTIDDDRIENHIANAEAKILGFLGGVYVFPFESDGSSADLYAQSLQVLKNWAMEYTRINIWRVRKLREDEVKMVSSMQKDLREAITVYGPNNPSGLRLPGMKLRDGQTSTGIPIAVNKESDDRVFTDAFWYEQDGI